MRRCTYFFLIKCIPGLLFTVNIYAQASRSDSSSQQNALNNASTLFYASLGKSSPLFNGEEHYDYTPTITGNAYFLDVNSFSTGSVMYNGILFKGVPILYDVYSDNIIVLLHNNFTKYSLIKDKVSSFDLMAHHIINIDSLSLPPTAIIKPGFYDEVYKGKLEVLVKRSKNIQTTSGLNTLESYFNPSINYYLKKNNVYYEISGKGSLLDLLKDKKKDIQQYIRANQINYRKDPAGALVKIASYYDHITN
jgi:hypothetical protein